MKKCVEMCAQTSRNKGKCAQTSSIASTDTACSCYFVRLVFNGLYCAHEKINVSLGRRSRQSAEIVRAYDRLHSAH